MPAFLKGTNENGAPKNAVWVSSCMVQTMLFVIYVGNVTYLELCQLTSCTMILPYFLSAAYMLKIAVNGELYSGKSASALASINVAPDEKSALLVKPGSPSDVDDDAIVHISVGATAVARWDRSVEGKILDGFFATVAMGLSVCMALAAGGNGLLDPSASNFAMLSNCC